MSLEAFIWVAKLPMDAMPLAPRCVLSKLADHAHRVGRDAFRAKEGLATELGCSVRTIQRALAWLRDHEYIYAGDQDLVSHIRADRRPVVYDLNLGRPRVIQGLDDETVDGESDLSRGDSPGSNGGSSAVALGTVTEPTTTTTQRNHTGAVTPSPSHCEARGSVGHLIDPTSGYCVACTRRLYIPEEQTA